MIVHPKNEDIPYMKKMWKDTFGDSDFYIDLVFSKKITSDSSLIFINENRPVSMMFYTRYDIKFYNEILKAGYVFGAATEPEYRGMGIMGSMLECSFMEMKSRGDAFTVLIPSSDRLFDYYEKFGYRAVFYRKKAEYSREDIKGEPVKLIAVECAEDIFDIYKNKILQKKIAVMQNLETYSIVICDYLKAGGEVLITGEKNAFCFAIMRGGKLYVKEIISQNEDYNSIIYSLFLRYPDINSIIVESFADKNSENNIMKTGMAKILDKDIAYSAYKSYKNEELDLEDEKFCEKLFLNDEKPYMNMMLD